MKQQENVWTGTAHSVEETAAGWRVWESNSSGVEFYRTPQDRLSDPHISLYNGYRIISGGKTTATWRRPPTPSRAQVKERIQLYFYSVSVPSRMNLTLRLL